jgi:phytoene synthase
VTPETKRHDAAAYCRDITKQHAKNFYYAFLFLPRRKREAIYSVYAFCRYCDDIADEEHIATSPQALLAEWRQELDCCYDGKPTHIITQALHPVITSYAIPKHYFEELIDGVAMDLTMQRYPTFTDLEQYCYRVASVVGLICIEIFGYAHPGVRTYARDIGIALQLINIIRDVKEDAERDRIYIPIEDLQLFKCSEASILEHQYTPEFADLMAFQAQRAHDYYRKAQASIRPADKAGLMAPEIMAAIYRATLRKITRQHFNVFKGRASLLTVHKLAIALYVFAKIWLASRLFLSSESSPSNH